MNLSLEKGERITTGGKGRGEVGGEAGEVTGVVADAPTMDDSVSVCLCVPVPFVISSIPGKSFHFPFP